MGAGRPAQSTRASPQDRKPATGPRPWERHILEHMVAGPPGPARAADIAVSASAGSAWIWMRSRLAIRSGRGIGGGLASDDVARPALFVDQQPHNILIREVLMTPTGQERLSSAKTDDACAPDDPLGEASRSRVVRMGYSTPHWNAPNISWTHSHREFACPDVRHSARR